MNKGNNFILPKGFKLGHADKGVTGVTVIVAENGAIGGVDCRGGAPGTRETDLLSPYKAMQTIHAVVLSGGSAYGLESASGVMESLRDKNIGYPVGGNKIVPIVPAAVIFDLNTDGYVYPDKETGRAAVENAFTDKEILFGNVGVGKGATVAKLKGPQGASKGGVGGAGLPLPFGGSVSAVIGLNALGEIYDHNTNQKIAGVSAGADGNPAMGENTTIGCIITDVKLDKLQANKLARLCHNALAKTIKPVHTDYDGDTLFVLSYGEKQCDFTVLGEMAIEAVCLAVENALNN